VIYEAFPVETVKPPRSRRSSERGGKNKKKKTQIGITRQRRLWPSDSDTGTGVWEGGGNKNSVDEELRNLYLSPT